MDILFLLMPLSLMLVAGIVWVLIWAVRSGQFDDLEGPAHRILTDEDEHPPADGGDASGAGPRQGRDVQ